MNFLLKATPSPTHTSVSDKAVWYAEDRNSLLLMREQHIFCSCHLNTVNTRQNHELCRLQPVWSLMSPLITSRVSGRGNVFGRVRPSLCPSVCEHSQGWTVWREIWLKVFREKYWPGGHNAGGVSKLRRLRNNVKYLHTIYVTLWYKGPL